MRTMPPFLARITRGLLIFACAIASGCMKKDPPKATTRYPTLPEKRVPAFLRNTIYERCDLMDTEPLPISGYGVVVGLQNTGDNAQIPNTVRTYIIKQMVKQGVGSKLREPPWSQMQPEEMLRDPRVAIVRVDGYMPAGARKGDHFDVQVSALDGSNTTSVARGTLWQMELKRNGANTLQPGYEIGTPGVARGPVFVNPAYALENGRLSSAASAGDSASRAGRTSLRYGVIMDGAMAMEYRPLILRLRAPNMRLSRAIQYLLEQRFASLKKMQDERVAAAKDEGVVFVQVPDDFRGDWAHFAGVMTHLYLDTRPEFLSLKAKELADAALQPEAPLMDISYAWEGIGPAALPRITPLIGDSRPEVAFAAARAAAYIGDAAAQNALLQMAMTRDHPFQLNAVQVLGDMPSSPSINGMLRQLLNTEQAQVRVEAYRVLARSKDSSIYSKQMGEKFILDIVPSTGPALIYATRSGFPRIAVIGSKPSLNLPCLFTAMDSQFSISSVNGQRIVRIYYRGPEVRKPAPIASNPDIAEIVARLGGEGGANEPRLDFSYADIVAILQALSDARQVGAPLPDGKRGPVAFMLQQAPDVDQAIQGAPIIPDQRPQGDGVIDQQPPARPQRSPAEQTSMRN
jgi:hypothetical protein